MAKYRCVACGGETPTLYKDKNTKLWLCENCAYRPSLKLVNCHLCGKQTEKSPMVKKPVCFNCQKKNQKIYSAKWFREKRARSAPDTLSLGQKGVKVKSNIEKR